ncbi:cell division protein FtsK [Catellatospora sp. NPDC049609]|uniref:cell division protein FtsK n=1 Tax=Catellatospora sp. NPDC049609 TaxID=3155505 RepID=UPI0034187CE3
MAIDENNPRDWDAGMSELLDQAQPAMSHFDVALDEQPQRGGMLVEQPEPAAPRRAVIPPVLRSWPALRAETANTAGRWANVAAFHAVRGPWYAGKAAFYALAGGFKLTGRQLRWWWVDEARILEQAAANAGDGAMWQKVHREGKSTRTFRGLVLLGEAAGLAVGVPVMVAAAPWYATAGVAVLAGLGLAAIGKPAGASIVSRAQVASRFRKLNPDIVLRAYYAAGLGHPDKAGQQIAFGSTMARDPSGTGSQVVIDLPYGKGLDDAVKARDKIASGLDVALSQVFISRDPTSHRRHVLWVADRDPLALPAGRTPLLRCQPADIWQPAPFGLDERGRAVALDLMWNSMLVGAFPRQGKTFAARALALYGALDPYVKLTVLDGGGKPDWRRFSLVADRYAFGLAITRDGDPVETVLEALRELKEDVQARYEKLSRLPVDVCPDGKLTRDIARNPKYAMPVRMVVMDEFQEYFDLGEQSKEIASLLVYLVKVAPAAGVIFIDATQRPSGIGNGQIATQFINFRDNHQVRFSLRTGSWQMSDLVLGSGAYGEGHDSSTLLPSYKGVGILRGATDETPTVRTYLADADDAEKILKAARIIREHAGTLSGMAAGETVARQRRDVLADAAAMFTGENGLSWLQLAERLALRLPEHYADLTAETISAQLRALGLPSVNIKEDGRALKGVKFIDIKAAIHHRDR